MLQFNLTLENCSICVLECIEWKSKIDLCSRMHRTKVQTDTYGVDEIRSVCPLCIPHFVRNSFPHHFLNSIASARFRFYKVIDDCGVATIFVCRSSSVVIFSFVVIEFYNKFVNARALLLLLLLWFGPFETINYAFNFDVNENYSKQHENDDNNTKEMKTKN